MDWTSIAKRYGYTVDRADFPWWKRRVIQSREGAMTLWEQYTWVRLDGKRCGHKFEWAYNETEEVARLRTEEEARILAEVDKEYPLPVPEPACGQVWHFATGKTNYYEAVALEVATNPRRVRWPDGWVTYNEVAPELPDRPVWPPRGGALVAGPGAPWAPSDLP